MCFINFCFLSMKNLFACLIEVVIEVFEVVIKGALPGLRHFF